MHSRREFLGLTAGAAGASLLHAAPARKPNFLIVLADDMGFRTPAVMAGIDPRRHDQPHGRRGICTCVPSLEGRYASA